MMRQQAAGGFTIEVRNLQRKHKIDQGLIRDKSKAILALCGLKDVELSILIVNNQRIQDLNKTYRGIDKPTDVLSFPMMGTELNSVPASQPGKLSAQPLLLGDVVLSMEKIQSQAREQGHSVDCELMMLLTHGILHLIGYDHERSLQEERRMRKKEGLILAKI
ncbi:MAG: rRNA maturation RNase YbeY [Nitrospirae bacterium]|nr:rRNA maturation RNase YbeY [Nitrospirota bacterium]